MTLLIERNAGEGENAAVEWKRHGLPRLTKMISGTEKKIFLIEPVMVLKVYL